jgi:TIR domain-containing protein
MAQPTRIFVSHSSKDNDLTKAVCALLKAPGPGGEEAYQVLVDTDSLEGGDPWPIQLHEMMADCHAAVVLLTDHALASAWVLKEATILTWRKSLEPEFKLFIAQLRDFTDDELRSARYEPLQHRQIQGLRDKDPAGIAQGVRTRLQLDKVAAAQTLFERVGLSLSALLEDLSPGKLQAVAQRLAVPVPPWRPGQVQPVALIDGIASRILRGQLGGYASLKELMNELKGSKLTAETLDKILRFAAPHWVGAEAAGPLGWLVEEQEGEVRCRAAALNGKLVQRYTGKMYVLRAFPLSFEQRVCPTVPPQAGDVLAHYTQKIFAFCVKEFAACEEMEDPQEVVDWLRQATPRLFVIVAPLDRKALADLQAAFPRVRFLIAAGETLDRSALPEGVVALDPPVDMAAESAAKDDYDASRDVVNA